MRNPSSYGSVTKLKGNRRKPYMIRVTIEYKLDAQKDKMIQKRAVIGYAKTRAEANEILASYNMRPFNLDYRKFTFKDSYDEWMKEYEKNNRSHSSMLAHQAAFKAIEPYLARKPIRDIKIKDLQDALARSNKNYPTLRKIKVMFNHVFKWAMKNDVINKDYSRYIDLIQFKGKNPNSINRKPFTDKEIEILWANSNDVYVQYVLIYIYTGLRASELLDLLKKDINMDEHVFKVVSSKTEAGKRVVPIADKIYPFFVELMKSDSDHLIVGMNGKEITYNTYFNCYYKPLMEKLGLDHNQIHDTRHTCTTLMHRARVDQTNEKKILGHAGAMSLTEKIYTHPDYQELLETINKI